MASSKIRKAIGSVKDRTSIGLAKVSSKIAPELVIAIVKATGHEDEPADERRIREIIDLASYSRCYASACVFTISRRLSKTRDWIVALKTLMLVHRLITDGIPAFHYELLFVLNLSYFRDEVHHSSWDHSAFVRTYALYLDRRLDYVRSSDLNFSLSPDEARRPAPPLREMKPANLLDRMDRLQQLFDRFLACRPIGMAKNNRMISVALYPIVRESFQLYADICEILGVLLERYFDMEYADCLKSFEAYATAAKQIDELHAFYAWCKGTGVAKSSDYPEVHRITDKLLETMREFKKEREMRLRNSSQMRVEPAATAQEAEHKLQIPPQLQADLVDLRNDIDGTADGNNLALALFSTLSEDFGEEKLNPAIQTPVGEEIKADWEIALVETASELAKQTAAFREVFPPLPLNAGFGSTRSANSPAAGGAVQNNGGDPFAASLSIPPPQEQQQQLWGRYTLNGMQGQASPAELDKAFNYPNPAMNFDCPTNL